MKLMDLQPALLITYYVQAVIATLFVALRGYAARTANGKIRWDFIWIVLAQLLHWLDVIPLTKAVSNGLGRHLWHLEFPQGLHIVLYFWLMVVIGMAANVFSKFSIISLLSQLHSPQAKKAKMALYIQGGIFAAVSVVAIFTIFFQCDPMKALWDVDTPGDCPRSALANNYLIFQGSVSAALDLILALWPISIVYNLQMSARLKYGFCLLMAISLLPCAAVIARVVLIKPVEANSDGSYQSGMILIWGITESGMIIILGSIPPLRPLFHRVKRKLPTSLGTIQSSTVKSSDYRSASGRKIEPTVAEHEV